jgi:hypothetical protein
MEVTYLPNRKAVVECGIQLVQNAQQQWIGMGRTAAWIKLPEFRKAIEDASQRDVNLKIVIFYEGNAEKHTEDWCSFGATVAFFEHGYIRLIISDYDQAMVAFPKVVTSLYEDREYFGFHIQGETAVGELLNYFNQIWEEAAVLGTHVNQQAIDEARWAKYEGFASGILKFVFRIMIRAFPDLLGLPHGLIPDQ